MNEGTKLTGGGLLARNTIINLSCQGVAFIVGIIAIPFLIKGLGTERFGVLSLAWMFIGYFTLFDLGLGRALTQKVSASIGYGRGDDISSLIWSALLLMFLLGVIGLISAVILSPYIVEKCLKVPKYLYDETLFSFFLLSFSIPVVIITIGLAGILRAYQRFDLLNMVRIPMLIYNFGAPLVVLIFSPKVSHSVLALIIGRLFFCMIHLLLCYRVVPQMRGKIRLDRGKMKQLAGFGGWMTVSNIVNPLMTYTDRFFIGSVISMSAVAYYVTPYEIVTKFWQVAGAFVTVLFSAFSTSFIRDPKQTERLFIKGVKYLFLFLFPGIIVLVALSNEILLIWLGAEFADNGTLVMQWLAIGVFINCLAHIPFALIQGVGRPDITAIVNFVELPFYLVVLYYLTKEFGITGAAAAWTCRVIIDAVIQFLFALKLLKTNYSVLVHTGCIVTTAALMILVTAALLPSILYVKCIFLFIVMVLYAIVCNYHVLTNDERLIIRNKLNAIFQFNHNRNMTCVNVTVSQSDKEERG